MIDMMYVAATPAFVALMTGHVRVRAFGRACAAIERES
jgi:hypothetical protein